MSRKCPSPTYPADLNLPDCIKGIVANHLPISFIGLQSLHPMNSKVIVLTYKFFLGDITKGWMTGSQKAKGVLAVATTRLKGETVYCNFCCDSLHLGAIIKATSQMDSSSLCPVHESLQSKTTHCTAGRSRCENAASLLILKSALAKACTGEGLILQNYLLND